MSQEQDCHNGLSFKKKKEINPRIVLLLISEQAAQQAISPILGQDCKFPSSLKKDACPTACLTAVLLALPFLSSKPKQPACVW